MKCRDCGKEIPETPVFFVGKRKPLCWDDFIRRRKKGRQSWWRWAPNNVFIPIQHG